MTKRVKVLEFKVLRNFGISDVFYMLALSPESQAAGGITKHAD